MYIYDILPQGLPLLYFFQKKVNEMVCRLGKHIHNALIWCSYKKQPTSVLSLNKGHRCSSTLHHRHYRRIGLVRDKIVSSSFINARYWFLKGQANPPI
jgi:hypothetical protein